jgi:hypothetical protein
MKFNSYEDSIRRHLKWLDTIVSNRLVTQEVSDLAKQVWHQIWRQSECLMPVPPACTGPDGQVSYCWNMDEHHFEVEIVSKDEIDVFYRNRQTKETWLEENQIDNILSARVTDVIKLFI